MNDRETQLMYSGMKLFAEKGYYNASVEEISNAAGVSKGTFYLYFQSKKDFITRTIGFHHDEIKNRLEMIKARTDLDAKESMAAQIAVLMDYVYTYKNFIMMHLRKSVPNETDTGQLIWQMKVENFNWVKKNLQKMYPDRLENNLVDAVIQCEAILNGYFKWIVTDGIEIDSHQAGDYIVRRIDDLVTGMVARDEPPLVRWQQIPEQYNDWAREEDDVVRRLISSIKTAIRNSDHSEARQAELIEVADMIEAETSKDTPQQLVIQGMLAHYTTDPVLHDLTERLAFVLGVSLLEH